jgi:hypothetical protein
MRKMKTKFSPGGGFYVRINNNWFLQGITSNTKQSKSLLNPTCNYAAFALFTNVTFYNGKRIDFLLNFCSRSHVLHRLDKRQAHQCMKAGWKLLKTK